MVLIGHMTSHDDDQRHVTSK